MKVLILGATGMVGQSILRECLLASDVSQVVTLTRAPVQEHAKLEQLIAKDLHHADDVLAKIVDFDACFFCLGISSSGISEEAYRHTTYDLTINIAQALFANNANMRFVYISGAGADSSEQGKTMWANVRGATENALQKIPFAAVYCLRPAVILPQHGVRSKTASYRWFYRLARPFFALMHRASNAVLTSEELALAMLNIVRFGAPKTILEAKDIRPLAHGKHM